MSSAESLRIEALRIRDRLHSSPPTTEQQGAKTILEWSRIFRMSHHDTSEVIREMVRLGRMKPVRIVRKRITGTQYTTVAYAVADLPEHRGSGS